MTRDTACRALQVVHFSYARIRPARCAAFIALVLATALCASPGFGDAHGSFDNPTRRFLRVPEDPPAVVRDKIGANPNDYDLRSDYGWYLYTAEGDLSGAQAELRAVCSVAPAHAVSLARLAFLATGVESPQEVVDAWHRAETAGWHEQWYQPQSKGRALQETGQSKQAVGVLMEGLRQYPNNRGILGLLPGALLETGQMPEAWYYARWDMALNPESEPDQRVTQLQALPADADLARTGDRMLWRALRTARGNNVSEALPLFETALTSDFYRSDLALIGYLEYADTCAVTDDYDRAVSVLQRARRAFPRNGVVYLALATAFHALGRDEEAREEIQRLQELHQHYQPNKALLSALGPAR